jgi:crotonobetaine/carnitine-CoA ligase
MASGRSEISMATGRSVGWLLDERAGSRADHSYLIWEPPDADREVWTFGSFARDVRRISAGLLARGVQPGDRLLLHLENCPEFLLTWFAAARIGAVPVCTNIKSARDEMRYFGEHSGVVAAITQPSMAELVSSALPDLGWTALTSPGERASSDRRGGDADSFASLFAEDPGDAATPVPDGAAAWIQYTSGTTSRPKGVVLSHANGVWGAKMCARNEGLTAADVHFVHLPLFHINALCYSMLSSLWVGCSAVLVPRFRAETFWEISRRNGCTWASVIPYCTQALAEVDPPEDHTYRLWGNGISIPAGQQPYGIRNLGWYGMTETIAHPIIDDVDTPGRFGSMGRPAPGYQVSLRGPDGSPVDVEEPGDLFIRGEPGLSLFAGYLHDDEATRQAVDPDGWLATGDRAIWHADGSFSFCDRSKDMLKVGGENVAASEVERVILEIPGVSEVAVVGAGHRSLGEVPVAFVIPRAGATGLEAVVRATCEERLATFKVPRDVRIVEQMPRSTLNKVAKTELRALLQEEQVSTTGNEA